MASRCFLTALILLSATAALGQDAPPPPAPDGNAAACETLVPGSTIRIRLDPAFRSDRHVGVFHRCDGGGLRYRPLGTDAEPMRVPIDRVLSLDVSEGESSNLVLGAVLGTGAMIGADSPSHQWRPVWDGGPGITFDQDRTGAYRAFAPASGNGRGDLRQTPT